MMELSEMSIGIANLPNQIHRRNVIKGFDFNLLVAGDSGLGKSTFLNMLFQSDLYTEIPYDKFAYDCTSQPLFKSSSIVLNENSVKLRMELIELGDIGWNGDDEKKWDEITSYITDRLEKYLSYEDICDSTNENLRDPRIHCCLYFIPPLSHKLRAIDINFLKAVGKWVNVIPLISKADTLTRDELESFKHRIREDLEANDIQIYTFPELNNPDAYQPSISRLDSPYKPPHYNIMPFAIAGSRFSVVDSNGITNYIRKYPWGTVKIDDPNHSDFEIFNNLFLKTHMFHMIFYTKKCIYEKYRREQLSKKLGIPNDPDDDSLSCSDVSLLAHEVMNMEISQKKENEHLQQLEIELEAEYIKKAEEYRSLTEAASNDYQAKFAELEKQIMEETNAAAQVSRTNSKSSKNEKKKTLLKHKYKSK